MSTYTYRYFYIAVHSIGMYNLRMHSGDPKKMLHRQVNIRLSDDLHKRVAALADRITSSVSQIIREALINYLDEIKKK